ncbi:MAG: hypothetical protein M3Z23_06580 [Acidobacteriota bacterium]|nr:hypothetical protein [Acidobacteriota bacterium]
MPDILNVLSRWVHISSAIALLGGILYARLVAVPAMRVLGTEAQEKFSESLASRYRPMLYVAICGLLVSGVYNLLNKRGATPVYHAIIGVKMLLALHVFAVGFLMVQPANPKRARQMTGLLASGFAIVLLSALLRYISLSPVSLSIR